MGMDAPFGNVCGRGRAGPGAGGKMNLRTPAAHPVRQPETGADLQLYREGRGVFNRQASVRVRSAGFGPRVLVKRIRSEARTTNNPWPYRPRAAVALLSKGTRPLCRRLGRVTVGGT